VIHKVESMRIEKKLDLAVRRKWRVRSKVSGTPERPRMAVKFTGKHIYVQFVDDTVGNTLASVATRGKSAPDDVRGANVASAMLVGKKAAELALAKGIQAVVFDRGANRYHGKVKALADSAREAGLKF
jgi:large subunit ribosomal protein L18